MQRRHNAGNDNCADNAGIEGFNPGHHCQTATCHRVLSEIDAEVASPGHSHRVDEIVPGQETHHHRQTSTSLRLLSKANG
ncbi:Uncharacterised protein [Shigella sonnei]|nr:Uncharacterised protein [Shigella sonnei]